MNGSNVIASTINNYGVGAPENYASWWIFPDASTGTSSGLVQAGDTLNPTDESDNPAVYYLQARGIAYFSSKAEAAAGRSPLATTDLYTMGHIAEDRGDYGNYTTWYIDSGSSRGNSQGRQTGIVDSTFGQGIPAMYNVFPVGIAYFHTYALTGGARAFPLATTGSYVVGNITAGFLGTYTSWYIGNNDRGGSVGRAPAQFSKGSTIQTSNNSELYRLYPSGIAYYTTLADTTNLGIFPIATTSTYNVGTVDANGGTINTYTTWLIGNSADGKIAGGSTGAKANGSASLIHSDNSVLYKIYINRIGIMYFWNKEDAASGTVIPYATSPTYTVGTVGQGGGSIGYFRNWYIDPSSNEQPGFDSQGVSNGTQLTSLNNTGLYKLYPVGIIYYRNKGDSESLTSVPLAMTPGYTIGDIVGAGSVGPYVNWFINPESSTGTSTGAKSQGNTLASATPGLYALYPVGILYYSSKVQSNNLLTSTPLAISASYTVGQNLTGSIGFYKYWYINVANSSGTTIGDTTVGSTLSSTTPALYILYPIGIAYFDTRAKSDSGTDLPIATAPAISNTYTENFYTVGYVGANSGSLGIFTNWFIGANSTGQTSPVAVSNDQDGILNNLDNNGEQYALYNLYPVGILYFANKNDALATVNSIAHNDGFDVGSFDAGSIGAYGKWRIAANSSGSSPATNSDVYANDEDTLTSGGSYNLYPVGIIYFPSRAAAIANTLTNDVVSVNSYTVGNGYTGPARVGWIIEPTLTRGSSRGAYGTNPGTAIPDKGTVGGIDGALYMLYPINVVYFASQADALANVNIISSDTSVAVKTVGVYVNWMIEPSKSQGEITGSITYDDDLDTSGIYFLYPIGIVYYNTQSQALAAGVTGNSGNTATYMVGDGYVGPRARWAIASNSTGTSVRGVYNNGYALNSTTMTGGAAIYYMYFVAPCFKEGTLVLCLVDGAEKYLPIETLKPGVLVRTSLNGYKKLELIGKGEIENPGTDERIEQRLYKCSTANYPDLKQDLYITGCHSILEDELTEVQRAKTINHIKRIFVTDRKYRLMAWIDERSEPWASEGKYTIWHIALENNDPKTNYGIYVNGGLLVETCALNFLKNRSDLIVQV